MKKIYIAPATEVQMTEVENMLAESLNIYNDNASKEYDVLSRDEESFDDNAWGSSF